MRDDYGREYSDFEFEEGFEPCDSVEWPLRIACGSTSRVARFFPAGPRVGFLCGQGHKVKWDGRGLWIPLDVFGKDGQYAGMIPEELVPARKRAGLTTTLKISNAAAYRARVAEACSVCDCPPFHDKPLRIQLLVIAEHKKFLYHDIERYIRSMIEARVYTDDWFRCLPEDLQAEVRLAAAQSKIEADHGIPRKILQALWLDLSTQERSVATNALAFPMCGFCNKGKRSFLDSTDVIVKRFAKVRHNGIEAAAVRDDAYPDILKLCMKAQALRRQA
jgi:hypothetical protein